MPIMKNKKRLGVWDKKCLIWALLDQNLKNTKFHVKFITKGYFWTRIWKKLVPYLKSTPSNLSKQKLSCKKTLSFRPKISFLDSFRPKFEKIIVIFEISTFKSIKMQSFMLNNKKKYLGPKLLYFCLELEFEKTIVIFEISTLEFIKNEFLTIIVNLGIESVFSKSPASTFSEGPRPGLSPLYNVCQLYHIPWVISYVSSDYDYIYMKVIFISKQFNFYFKKNINMELKTCFFYILLNKNRVT